jgi:hypothetical protein
MKKFPLINHMPGVLGRLGKRNLRAKRKNFFFPFSTWKVNDLSGPHKRAGKRAIDTLIILITHFLMQCVSGSVEVIQQMFSLFFRFLLRFPSDSSCRIARLLLALFLSALRYPILDIKIENAL